MIDFNNVLNIVKGMTFNGQIAKTLKIDNVRVFHTYEWDIDSIILKPILNGTKEMGSVVNGSQIYFKTFTLLADQTVDQDFISDAVSIDMSGNFENKTISLGNEHNDLIFLDNTITVAGSGSSVVFDKDIGFTGDSVTNGIYPQVVTNNGKIIFNMSNDVYPEQELA